MKKITIWACMWLLFSCCLWSQDVMTTAPARSVNQSTLIGIGKLYLYDSYLSPLRYDGLTYSLLHDRINATRYIGGNLLLQQQVNLQLGVAHNPPSTSSEYYGNIAYRIAGLYPLIQENQLRLYAGVGWDASLGGIYNMRNTNNPGSLKASTNLHLSIMTQYYLNGITFRWQLSSPFGGFFFLPEYGHSYYEIFTLGNNKGTIHPASFHNQQALRNYLTVDIPVNKLTLRVGYLGDFYRANENQLITRITSHQIIIGLAFETLYFGRKRNREELGVESVYY